MSDMYDYIAVIVGESSDILRAHGNYGVRSIHMSKIKSRKEKEVYVLNYDGNVRNGNILSVCIKTNKTEVMDWVQKKTKSSEAYKKKRMEQKFDYALAKKIRDALGDFLAKNGSNFDTIRFEVDQDLRRAFTSGGLTCCNEGNTHQLADIVAWANHARMKLASIRDFDFVKELKKLTLKGA